MKIILIILLILLLIFITAVISTYFGLVLMFATRDGDPEKFATVESLVKQTNLYKDLLDDAIKAAQDRS